MKHSKHLMSIMAFSIFASPALAVELTGGEFNIQYSRLDDKIFDTRLERLSFDGAVEIGFNRNFAAQIDAGFYDFGAIDESGSTLTLHGIYHVDENLSFGAFVGQDDLDVLESDFYGLEVGYESGAFEVEAYLGSADSEGEDANLFGIAASYSVNEGFDITGAYELADFDDGSLDRFEVGVRYIASPQMALTASLGSADLEAFGSSGSDNFITVGMSFTFGAERGATFGRRGFLKLIPGL